MITGTTRLFAIIGDPVAHVRTPMAFNEYFATNGINAVCVAIHIGRDDLCPACADRPDIGAFDAHRDPWAGDPEELGGEGTLATARAWISPEGDERQKR